MGTKPTDLETGEDRPPPERLHEGISRNRENLCWANCDLASDR